MGFEPMSVLPHRISSPAPYQTRTSDQNTTIKKNNKLGFKKKM